MLRSRSRSGSATPGASDRYTTTGEAPTLGTGTVYAGPVSVGSTTTLRAIKFAVADYRQHG
ncbi:MAG: chitobiase/beta-hexosaminidase C-terminal domain-containing protein [Verrucomicrobia bacterium]|nr:chitobiase/beta-hexosaminidase C-terminal domain-containing protein [Verrucomicrobiota bacterium]